MAGEFMKSGKISQAVYDRSVFRPLKRSGSLDSGVFYGADSAGCAGLRKSAFHGIMTKKRKDGAS